MDRGIEVRFHAEMRDFSLLHGVQIGSGAKVVFNRIITGTIFQG
jgi:hypothetical protein